MNVPKYYYIAFLLILYNLLELRWMAHNKGAHVCIFIKHLFLSRSVLIISSRDFPWLSSSTFIFPRNPSDCSDSRSVSPLK